MATVLTDDYYALLGVNANADGAALLAAWRRLALQWHPDRAGRDATATFQKILAAYTVLSDPIARAAYDRGRDSSVPPTRRSAPAVMLGRMSGPLNSLLACGAVRFAEDDVLELLLGAREASEGGMVTISMPAPVRCPVCSTGPCDRCGMSRIVEELFSAWLAVPPGVADGTMLVPSALLSGMIRPVSFRARVRGGT
jgi:hypothetical protein